MILRSAVASLLAESGFASRLGSETTAGAATTAAQAAAPTNRLFIAFMAFVRCAVPRWGELSLAITTGYVMACVTALLACAHYSLQAAMSAFFA
jgi:hypothetical protein